MELPDLKERGTVHHVTLPIVMDMPLSESESIRATSEAARERVKRASDISQKEMERLKEKDTQFQKLLKEIKRQKNVKEDTKRANALVEESAQKREKLIRSEKLKARRRKELLREIGSEKEGVRTTKRKDVLDPTATLRL